MVGGKSLGVLCVSIRVRLRVFLRVRVFMSVQVNFELNACISLSLSPSLACALSPLSLSLFTHMRTHAQVNLELKSQPRPANWGKQVKCLDPLCGICARARARMQSDVAYV